MPQVAAFCTCRGEQAWAHAGVRLSGAPALPCSRAYRKRRRWKMDSVIAKAFAAFEGRRLAELLSEGVENEDAQVVVLQQWEAMDANERSRWSDLEVDASAPEVLAPLQAEPVKTPTPSRARKKRPVSQENRSAEAGESRVKALKPEDHKDDNHVRRGCVAPRSLQPAGDWICPAQVLEPSEEPDADMKDLHEQDDSQRGGRGDKEDESERRQHAFRTSQVVQVGGKHPDWLTEPAAVAEISLPRLSSDELVFLPRSVAEEGRLSSVQMESVAYAARRFCSYLPSGARAGYYLGDGTGCGKGRIIAALIWHLWNSGAKRHVWLSASSDLLEDATRDFRDLGAAVPLCSLSSMGYGPLSGHGLDADGNGVIFVSYQLLVACKGGASGVPTPETSRLGQLVDWLRRGKGGASGLIALDEAHRTKNVGTETQAGSKSGLSALELQRACPGAAVLYASATGATELRHLGYLERLGLWGKGRPHKTFEELRLAVEGGGLAAMELLAMTMRAEGMLSCRSLSFKGASFRLVPISLGTEEEAPVYVGSCLFWQAAFRIIVRLLKARTREVRRKKLKHTTELKENSVHMRNFWSAQQQFFRQLLICSKVDATVKLAEAAQLRGEAVVIAMWSTGESVTEAVANRKGDRSAAAAGFASAPKEVAFRMLNGLLRTLAEAVESEPSALQVAELTGRSRRLVFNQVTGETRFEERGDRANLEELRAFQLGRKKVAIVTEAASAGISLHCDRPLRQSQVHPFVCRFVLPVLPARLER
ncbi:let-765 [Symbiodinium necroappetens]|uniref:Let-765 protein n=1 Tax=Symbiodinium necroappetens TaxID=1628268 RepID=A0A812U9N5_9DINO|nr:let-765 [Symbiodinium necroappetens]